MLKKYYAKDQPMQPSAAVDTDGEDIKEVGYYEIEHRYRHLAGKVLTIIDASIADKEQLKAVKDLIKREFTIEIDKWQKYYWDNHKARSFNLELPDKIVPLI